MTEVAATNRSSQVPATRRGLARGTLLGFLLAAVLVVASAVAAVVQLGRTRDAAEESQLTFEVLDRIDVVLRHLIDAETGQRGFVLTGERSYLQPYERAVESLPSVMAELRASFRQTPDQAQRLAEIEPLIESKLTEIESTIHLRNLGGAEAAIEVIRTDFGRKVMEDIRSRIEAIRHAEQRSLRANLVTRERRSQRTLLLILLGSSLATAVLLIATVALSRSARQRNRAERGLRESSERLRVTLRSIGDAVIATDRDGKIVFLNPVAQALTGWPEQEARERALDEVFAIFNEETRAVVESPVAKVLRSGSVVGLANHTLLRSRDGRETPIDDSGAPIRDADGEIMGVVLVFRDASERRRSQDERERILRVEVEKAATASALRRTESERALLQAIFDTAPIGLGVLDRDLRFVRVNRALARLNGLKVEGHLGRRLSEVLPGTPARVFSDLEHVLRTGQPVLDTEVQLETDGAERFWRASYVPVRGDSGEVLGLAEVVEDVTERRRAESERERLYQVAERARAEAEEANRAKDEFLAIVSHELRSPLSAMAGWVRILASRCLGDEMVDRALRTLERNIRVQTQIISDLLDVSRFLSGKLRLNLRVTNLASTVETSVESARPLAIEREIRLESALPAGAVLVRGDSDRLAQVLTNLINNAIKFTPSGGAVAVSLSRAGDEAEVVVRDTGQGIEPQLLPHVFERFRQGESASTRTHGGLGLGLAIVKHLVELHGGSVRADSNGRGTGATFTVRLPIELEASEAPALAAAAAGDGASGLEGLRLLVVEDDVDSREALQLLLGDQGIVVDTAGSLPEAIAAFDRARPDLLVSDIGLPGGSGYDLIRQLRDRDEPGRRLLAIAMTGFASKHDHEEALRAGFDEHLRKPLDLELLLERVRVLAAALPGRTVA